MSADRDVLNELRPLLRESLERFGAEVACQVAGVQARVDDLAQTRFYSLVAILSFVRADDRETEVAAVSVHRREDGAGAWAIDATGHGSRWLAEYAPGPDGDPAIDMRDAVAVLAGIEAIIRAWVETIVAELKS